MNKCHTCGATYLPIQRDGTTYFHRCSPLSAAELAAAVAAGKVSLPEGETADDAVLNRTYERHNARNENLPSTAEQHGGKLLAAGAGVSDIGEPADVVVIVKP